MIDDLEKIAEEVRVCVKCPLSKTRTNAVPGNGSEKSQILFVGEAPGFHEDKDGIPFCGNAGKFLNEMLEEIGLSREEVFITNTIKCRPPENRDPEESEKDVCRPYLDRQLSIIKPKLIVCLGRHSVATFLPGAGGISNLHGKAVKRPNGQVYLALYHPAAALHNGSLRETLKEDFRRIPAVLKKIGEAEGQEDKECGDDKKGKGKQQKLI